MLPLLTYYIPPKPPGGPHNSMHVGTCLEVIMVLYS